MLFGHIAVQLTTGFGFHRDELLYLAMGEHLRRRSASCPRSLPQHWSCSLPGDRSQAVVLAANYGEAGAMDLFGPRLGLPRAVSAAGSYWFFWPGSRPGAIVCARWFSGSRRTCCPA